MSKTRTPKRNHWDDIPTRIEATLAFTDYLRNNPKEVAKCVNNNDHAKKTFANGYFYLEGETQANPANPLRFIPKKTVFRVYEFDPKVKRDELVTIVLPDPSKPLKEIRAGDIWLCTWSPWLTVTGEYFGFK